MSSRSIRDEYGDYQPSLIVSNTNDKKIIFSRSIFNELDDTQYTYRIEYDFSNQQLKRNIWNVLDRIQNSNYQTHVLDENILDGVYTVDMLGLSESLAVDGFAYHAPCLSADSVLGDIVFYTANSDYFIDLDNL